MPIIAFQHSETCRPGRLGLTLRDHAFRVEVIRLDKGGVPPVDFDDVDGVISLGGPQNVDEGHAWIERECDFVREAHDRSLPVVGVCLGSQLVARALGGNVGPMERGEAGLIDVDLTPPGQTDTILAGIAWRSPQFQKHRYEVKVPPAGATVLAKSERCAVQAYRVGMRTYGFQYHLEADRAMIDALMKDARTELHQSGSTSEEFAKDLDRRYPGFARLADRLCVNIATYLIPRVATAIRV